MPATFWREGGADYLVRVGRLELSGEVGRLILPRWFIEQEHLAVGVVLN